MCAILDHILISWVQKFSKKGKIFGGKSNIVGGVLFLQ